MKKIQLHRLTFYLSLSRLSGRTFAKFVVSMYFSMYFAHIYFLIGVRAPLIVGVQWFWNYLTYGRGARLITGTVPLFNLSQIKDSSKDDNKN